MENDPTRPPFVPYVFCIYFFKASLTLLRNCKINNSKNFENRKIVHYSLMWKYDYECLRGGEAELR